MKMRINLILIIVIACLSGCTSTQVLYVEERPKNCDKVGEIFDYSGFGYFKYWEDPVEKYILTKAKALLGNTVFVYDPGYVEESLIYPNPELVVHDPAKMEVFNCR